MVIVFFGVGLLGIIDWLFVKGVIQDDIFDEWVFNFGICFYKNVICLKVGEYVFVLGVFMKDVMIDFVEGNVVIYLVMIFEGWMIVQIVDWVCKYLILVGEIIVILLEGVFLLEIYMFVCGMMCQGVLDQMKVVQDKLLVEVWERCIDGLLVIIFEELVIFVLIVEKEMVFVDEWLRVVGVFVNCLNCNMCLQLDLMIFYGFYGGEVWFEDCFVIKQFEINVQNDYNIYQIDGLLVGLIGNLGCVVMEVVVNFLCIQDLFFVVDGIGGYVFVEIYEQYQLNVCKWCQIECECC